ncbi:MAG: MHS family proline/betaine transporter-like MFS transporter [Francisellaceae bacterium]|jgi:MHS family proline/betaine transporter-like MFS transporter
MPTPSKMKTMWFTAFGASLEWFEFSLYGYLAVYLSAVFFPGDNKKVGLIAIFGIFAASYFMRPIGGFVMGHIGDRLGRRKAIVYSISLMCIPMLIMSFMPTYDTAGVWAIVILIFARMLQGFSVGGEFTGVLVMLSETAPSHLRGFAASLASTTSQIGVIISTVTVAVLASVFSYTEMLAYGWRIAFFIGFILGLVSLFMQHSVSESPYFEEVKKEHKEEKIPLLNALKGPKMPLVWVFVLTGYIGIAYYMMGTYLPNNFISSRGMGIDLVMWIMAVTSIIYAVTSPLFGWFSDLWGRKIMLYIPIILLMLVAYPMFMWLENGSTMHILIAEGVFACLVAAMTSSFQITVSELFPTEHRYSGMSAAYNVGNAMFAGTTPMISLALVGAFNTSYAPCYYLIIASIITLLIIWKMPETRKAKYFDE